MWTETDSVFNVIVILTFLVLLKENGKSWIPVEPFGAKVRKVALVCYFIRNIVALDTALNFEVFRFKALLIAEELLKCTVLAGLLITIDLGSSPLLTV